MDANISYFTTEKGSVYLHLEDGRVQRYKAITRKLSEPRDLTVFLPDYDFVRNGAPESQLEKLGKNEMEYHRILSSAVYGQGNKIHIIGEDGRQIEDNRELKRTQQRTFLRFTKDGKIQFYIPVSENPQMGMTPYESTLEENGGRWYRTRHLGHKVTEIQKINRIPSVTSNILNKLK